MSSPLPRRPSPSVRVIRRRPRLGCQRRRSASHAHAQPQITVELGSLLLCESLRSRNGAAVSCAHSRGQAPSACSFPQTACLSGRYQHHKHQAQAICHVVAQHEALFVRRCCPLLLVRRSLAPPFLPSSPTPCALPTAVLPTDPSSLLLTQPPTQLADPHVPHNAISHIPAPPIDDVSLAPCARSQLSRTEAKRPKSKNT